MSADRHTTLILVTLAGSIEEAEAHTDAYLDSGDGHSVGNGFEVYTAGDLSVSEEFNAIAENDCRTPRSSACRSRCSSWSIVFGALVAAGVPILVALVAIVGSLGLAALIGRAFELSFFVTNMITLIGLAVGIDYALFVIERYREERRRGLATLDAIALAGDTAAKAVLFSGITVILALLGMLLIPTTIFRSLGLGAILAVLVAVAATLTLLPAPSEAAGRQARLAASPRRSTRDGRSRQMSRDDPHGFWGRVTHTVMAHPVSRARGHRRVAAAGGGYAVLRPADRPIGDRIVAGQ